MYGKNLRFKTKIVVIGAGQAGLSSAYHLKKLGLEIGRDFIILDEAPNPGGAWQFRWSSLTLSTVNKIHDLPGMSFEETLETDEKKYRPILLFRIILMPMKRNSDCRYIVL